MYPSHSLPPDQSVPRWPEENSFNWFLGPFDGQTIFGNIFNGYLRYFQGQSVLFLSDMELQFLQNVSVPCVVKKCVWRGRS